MFGTDPYGVGRGSLGKGHFSSPTTYFIDIIQVSELPQYQNKFLLHQKYVLENLSAKEIATSFGCSATTIKKQLREFRLNKGGCGNGVHKQKLAYGKKLVSHALVVHKGETQILESIKRMYGEEGLGPTAIARILNTMKVPTKKQGKGWDHSVIADILIREGIYKQTRKSPRQGEQ